MTRLFFWLIAAQAAHSLEEYFFRLYDVLAPARWVASLFSSNLRVGFAIGNALLVLFGIWCYAARVRPHHRSARAWAWFWAALETANGIGHLAFAVDAGGYFPGAATAPVLLALGVTLAVSLGRGTQAPAAREV
jgi:hypothetical protein